MASNPRIGYFFSRYPLRSQTFTDNEMLGLEQHGVELIAASIHPPLESFRQPNLNTLRAPVLYGPSRESVAALEKKFRLDGRWPEAMIARHDAAYGPSFQSALRARNACYFAERFEQLGVRHVHVPFANRALHTALFLREMTGITLSFTTHGQDFMVDLGSRELLAEMCAASEFVVAVCDYSRALLQSWCPESRDRIVRIYNGLAPAVFSPMPPPDGPLRILSVGRLIEFKGFHHLIDALALTGRQDIRLRIVGEGPWEEKLREQIARLDLGHRVELVGVLTSEEIREELRACHLFALASVVDSQGASDLLPTVITEAMFSGRAVLSTHTAGIPEMIVDGVTGRLIPAADPHAFAQAICELDADRTLLASMGAAGRSMAQEKFSLSQTTAQLAEQFSHVMPEVAPPQPASTIGIYDLSLPGRAGWLECELVDRAWTIAGVSGQTFVVPDGLPLEMEWRARQAWRWQLEALRTELSASVDGELFLSCARTAVWLAAHHRTHQPQLVYGAGTRESLIAWLWHKLSGVACALVLCDAWNGVLLRRMAADAAIVSNSTDRVPGARDHLLRESPDRARFTAWLRSARP